MVTSEESAEPEISESKLFADQVMEATPDFIMIYNLAEDRMEFVNRRPYNTDEERYRETLGISLEHLLTRAHPDDRQPLKQFIDSFRTAADNEVHTFDYRVLRDGQVLWYRSRGKVFKRNAAGVATHYISVVQDISEIKRLEEENLAMRLNQQKAMLLAILDVQEDERHRISEALHNGLGQVLYAAKLSLERLHDLPQTTDQQEALKSIQELLSEAINETRRVSHELSPVLLEEFGLEKALLDLCDQFQHSALYLNCNVTGLPHRLDTYMEVAIYRMSQELINNVIKHAGATAATLNLSQQQNNIVLQVRDNGVGFDPSKLKTDGIGLRTIQDRVKLLNGTMTLTAPKSGKGTLVTITIPSQFGSSQNR
ncbi:ATP-binding protein [Pontibacter sp. H259]|uniref:PAS domain-containing sensor histidine kinase n=1 Tax=Pontibacter sp. H259 TaxID=3133421 RepID=UPI0030C220B4